MNFFNRTAILLSLLLVTPSSFAVTVKYELRDIQSNNGWIHYPGLDFSNATSALLTIEKTSPETEPQLKSLDITFPNAAKLSVKDFKKVDGFTYRAFVNNAWIYRQVSVDVSIFDLNNFHNPSISIDVAISEGAGFINPEGEEQGEQIFQVYGFLRDITSTKVIDNGSVIINGKRANLLLKNRLGVPSPEAGGGAGGYTSDVLWMGKGEKTIYIPSDFPPNYYDFITPTGLVLEELTSPEGPMIGVIARDHNGNVIPSPMFRLKELLEQAYGPQP
jgi:hypothetical protein